VRLCLIRAQASSQVWVVCMCIVCMCICVSSIPVWDMCMCTCLGQTEWGGGGGARADHTFCEMVGVLVCGFLIRVFGGVFGAGQVFFSREPARYGVSHCLLWSLQKAECTGVCVRVCVCLGVCVCVCVCTELLMKENMQVCVSAFVRLGFYAPVYLYVWVPVCCVFMFVFV